MGLNHSRAVKDKRLSQQNRARMAGSITETATQVSPQASLSNSGRGPSVLQTGRLTLDQRPRMLQRWFRPQSSVISPFTLHGFCLYPRKQGKPRYAAACSHHLCLLQWGTGLAYVAEKHVHWASSWFFAKPDLRPGVSSQVRIPGRARWSNSCRQRNRQPGSLSCAW